ncbi:MAG: hypothetical protein ACR2JZ_02340 [Candidatus Limnocylindrales bacterium]
MSEAARFAHASEAELARILDYYEVRWEYEPRAFPIRWNLAGAVVESFAPDFFLPDLDLYIELTTLRQSLVRKKNRKLRRLRELYPMLRVKLLYGKDFRALLLKYGRIDVVASMVGLEGQAQAEASLAALDQEIAAPAGVPTASMLGVGHRGSGRLRRVPVRDVASGSRPGRR